MPVADGILVGDLDCSGLASAPAVAVANHGSLDLNGFTITGGLHGVQCAGSCTVTGPGTIRDAEFTGIAAAGTVTASAVSLLDNGNSGIYGKIVILDNSTVSGSGRGGVTAEKRAVVSNSNFTTAGEFGVYSYRRAEMTNCDVVGSESGITGVTVAVSDSTLNDNEDLGVFGRTVKIENTTATGNGVICEGEHCGDVLARRVRAVALTCDTSVELEWPSGVPTGQNLKICAND
jgi:hypothetical protein